MARHGLSPYANPLDSAIDSFVKVSNVLRQRKLDERQQAFDDRAEQDRTDAEPLRNLQREAQTGQAEETIAQQKKAKQARIESEEMAPHVKNVHNLTFNMSEAASNGTSYEPSADQIQSVHYVAEKSGNGDFTKSVKKGMAANQLMQALPTITQQIQQSGNKQGRTAAPEVIEPLNQSEAVRVDGKPVKVTQVAWDEQGNIVPIGPAGPNGEEQPYFDKSGKIARIHINELQENLSHTRNWGALSASAGHYLDSLDPKKRDAMEENTKIKLTMADFKKFLASSDKQPTVTEQRAELTKIAAERGMSEQWVDKIRKDIIQDKEPKAEKKSPMLQEVEDFGGMTEQQKKDWRRLNELKKTPPDHSAANAIRATHEQDREEAKPNKIAEIIDKKTNAYFLKGKEKEYEFTPEETDAAEKIKAVATKLVEKKKMTHVDAVASAIKEYESRKKRPSTHWERGSLTQTPQ